MVESKKTSVPCRSSTTSSGSRRSFGAGSEAAAGFAEPLASAGLLTCGVFGAESESS